MALLNGSSGNDNLSGTNGSDIISGGSGNDTINGGGGADLLLGGAGSDTISGGDGVDIIDGGSGNDILRGDGGSDIINGGSGNDIMAGDAGNDILYGDDGNDQIQGDAGNDLLAGGSGSDLFIYKPNFGNDTILDFKVGTDFLRFDGISTSGVTLTQSLGSTLVRVDAQNSILLVGVTGVALSNLFQPTANLPPQINNQSLSILENSPSGQPVGTVAASDPEGGSLTYDIVGGSSLFTINSSTGLISANSSLNFEAQANYSLQVRVTDSGGLQSQALVAINVGNVNEAPIDITLSNANINESAAAGVIVGNLAAIDPDAGATATFTLLDNAGGLFAISGTQLVVAGALDYEANASYNITVHVTDNGGLSYDKTFTIAVNNVNEAPTDITLSNASVNESAAAGVIVGNLAAIDPDAGGTATFTLLDNAGGRFAISGNQLVVAGGLNYEANASHNITVHVTDNGGLSYDKTFSIAVNNVNEAPTDISLSNNIATDNLYNGTPIGNLALIDPDIGDSATFTLTNNSSGRFAISGNQLVSTGLPTPNGTFVVSVNGVDSGGLSFDKTFNIIINNPNDAPTDITLSNAGVNESAAAGVIVGNLAAIDPDLNDGATFTLVDNAGGRFAISGNQLVVAGALDYETSTTHSVVIRATDSGGLTFDKTLIINVNDVFENNNPDINAQSFAVNENSASGTLVGTLTATDPDAGDTFTYAFVENPALQEQIASAQANVDAAAQALANYSGGSTAVEYAILAGLTVQYATALSALNSLLAQDYSNFTINPLSGAITVAAGAVLDFEAIPSYYFNVSVTDAQGASDQAPITVNLNDVVEAPLFTAGIDTVNFNTVFGTSYQSGTQYNALGGNDIVILPDADRYLSSGYVLGTPFNAGDGADTITSGNSADVITGGNEADQFMMKIGSQDVITDFVPNTDFLDLGTGSPALAAFGRSYVWDVAVAGGNTTFYFDEAQLNSVTLQGDVLSGTWNNITLNGVAARVGAGISFVANANNIIYGIPTTPFIINTPTGYNTIVVTDSLAHSIDFRGNVAGSTIVQLGDGVNTISGSASIGILNLTGSISLLSGSANDRLVMLTQTSAQDNIADGGSLYINGGAGNDLIDSGQYRGVSIHLVGGEGDDLLIINGDTGLNGATVVRSSSISEGGNGNDILADSGSEDTITMGGAGNDRMMFANLQGMGSNTWYGGTGNDYLDLTNNYAGRNLQPQQVAFDVTWDGTNLISNDGTDFVKSFINGVDNILLNVTNTAAIAPTAADILAHITMGSALINTDTSPLVPTEFHSPTTLVGNGAAGGNLYASGGQIILSSNAATPDTLVSFGNTSVYFLDVNLTATPLSSLVDIHFV